MEQIIDNDKHNYNYVGPIERQQNENFLMSLPLPLASNFPELIWND